MLEKICSMCKKNLSLELFKKNKTKKDGLQAQCINCQKEYRKKHYNENRQKYIDKSSKRTKEFRIWWKIYKSNLKCEICGENHPATLDFHHIEQENKESEISGLISNANKKRLFEEISKCIIICSNCHRKIHYKE